MLKHGPLLQRILLVQHNHSLSLIPCNRGNWVALAQGEFRSPRSGVFRHGRIRRWRRKNKASLVQMRRRRAKRNTWVCASAATAQMSRNRRRFF